VKLVYRIQRKTSLKPESLTMIFNPRLLLLSLTPLAVAGSQSGVYIADITEIENPGTSSGVSGTAVVFVSGTAGVFFDADRVIGYTGFADGLNPNLIPSSCSANNGCGAHIHSGTSCEDTESQGGHYYVNPPVDEDPWVDEKYSSDSSGYGKFSGVVDIGTDDLEGRTFLSK
jgi:hypothetical protein